MKMYLWIDLETTGLDPDYDRIMEIGWFLSDHHERVTETQSVLITPDKVAWELMQQDLFVQTMHTENDLLKDMESFGTIMPEDAEDQILKDLDRHELGAPTLAGSSVHFDRAFIRNLMPRLDRRLSHRHLDTSALKMFFDSQGYMYVGEKTRPTVHRALQDIDDSFELYLRYAELVQELDYGYRTDDLDA
jgi:oligoribonuclease